MEREYPSDEDGDFWGYLSTHPATQERIDHLEKGS
jgi:Zn-dependent protease with chaperone function